MITKLNPKPRKLSADPLLDLRFTPPYAATPIMETLQLTEDDLIWECAAGQGDLIDAMRKRSSATFFGSDVLTGTDFFEDAAIPFDFQIGSSGIVTNPPYSIKPQFLRRCFELTRNVALLLPVESIASSKLQALWQTNTGVSMLLMDSRIDFKSVDGKWYESAANVPTAWFISGFGIKPGQLINKSIKTEKFEFKKLCRILNF